MRVYDLLVAGTDAGTTSSAPSRRTGAATALCSPLTGPDEVAARRSWPPPGGRTRRPRRWPAYADSEAVEWAYRTFGKRGKVASRQASSPDFTRLVFENGVALNFKQTGFQSGGVEIRVRFGHGERGLSAADRTADRRSPPACSRSAASARWTMRRSRSALANSTWAFTLEARADRLRRSSSSTLTDNVEQEMRLLAAYMTDPGFRPLIDEKLPTALDLTYRMFTTDPSFVAVLALERARLPGPAS